MLDLMSNTIPTLWDGLLRDHRLSLPRGFGLCLCATIWFLRAIIPAYAQDSITPLCCCCTPAEI